MTIVLPDRKGFAQAMDALIRDQVVAYPTETVYGLAVNPLSDDALNRLFSIKIRNKEAPVLLVVADESQLKPFVSDIDEKTRACMERFWPGPLSLLFPAASHVPDQLMNDQGQICIRCPDSPIVQRLCRCWQGALTSTSANVSGQAPARSAEEAALPGVALTLDGGTLEASQPSTVFDAAAGRIIRPGAVPEASLRDFCNHEPQQGK